jgi:glycosyltransferase involved in cell wall biosynthesis
MTARGVPPLSKRPKVLLLAYSFPPVNKIGGVRARYMAKYLTRQEWEVTVVTPAAAVWNQVEAPERVEQDLAAEGVRVIRTGHAWRMLSTEIVGWNGGAGWAVGGLIRRAARGVQIERESGWFAEAERACAGLTEHDVDVVLATGPPFGSFELARRIARRIGRPYVLDFRDLWVANPHLPRSTADRLQRREEAVLEGCAAAIAVSPSLAESLGKRHRLDGKIHILTNGFDPEVLNGVRPTDFGHFAIVYAGTFYPPKRVLTPITAALQELKSRATSKPWAFHYYGASDADVRREAASRGIEDRVVVHGKVSRDEALSAVRGAGVAAVITSVFPQGTLEDRGILTGKLFEAIGLNTPVLAIAPDGSDIESILKQTGLGRRFVGTAVSEIAEFLSTAMERPMTCGTLDYYGWPSIGGRLDQILRKIASAKRSSAGGERSVRAAEAAGRTSGVP